MDNATKNYDKKKPYPTDPRRSYMQTLLKQKRKRRHHRSFKLGDKMAIGVDVGQQNATSMAVGILSVSQING